MPLGQVALVALTWVIIGIVNVAYARRNWLAGHRECGSSSAYLKGA
jgi:predicted lysophospholipase L1 biosynthesis ABC-type transport system permease subunit